MGMTSPLDDVNYERRNFNFDPNARRHPLYITDKQVEYELVEDVNGNLVCARDVDSGSPIRTPRKLQEMCINFLVCDSGNNSPHHRLSSLDTCFLPATVYPQILTEAILFREPRAIEGIISSWPLKVLRIHDHLPLEDTICDDYMTLPFEGHDDLTLADCVVLGLLKLKPGSQLKIVDFSYFNKDRRLCKELSRLPILWMEPCQRVASRLHERMSVIVDISKEKVECYLNRIRAVYSNIDQEFVHENDIGPVIIETDMHINIDDVPVGLSLQFDNPFKFISRRIWMKPIPDVFLPINQLQSVLDSKVITHLEYEDPSLPNDPIRQSHLMESLCSLTNLVALSLPDCLNSSINVSMVAQLSSCLRLLRHLERVNFSYCNLRNNLETLLSGLRSRILYLNLKDCRLNEDDLFSLLTWCRLSTIRELNLSCNSLQDHEEVLMAMIDRMPHITCFSTSFCSLDVRSQVSILRCCIDREQLKVICMQGFIPPSQNDLIMLLEQCCNMPQLQKAILFPEAYAFPGDAEQDRRANKLLTLNFSYRLLQLNGRHDLKLE